MGRASPDSLHPTLPLLRLAAHWSVGPFPERLPSVFTDVMGTGRLEQAMAHLNITTCLYLREKKHFYCLCIVLVSCLAFPCPMPCLTISPPNVVRERERGRVCVRTCVHGNRFGGCLDPDRLNAAGQLCLINTH